MGPLIIRSLSVLAALAWWTTSLAAQTLRPFTTFRQARGERHLTAQVHFGNGSLRIVPGRPRELYRMELTYDHTLVPISDYDAANHKLVLGLSSTEQTDPATGPEIRISSGDRARASATVALSPQVETAVELQLATSEADVELGGLRVSSLDVKTGVGQTTIRFSQPNGISCRRASVDGGAAEISLLGLGNSRCEEIHFNGGAGIVVLDFGGTWTSNTTVHATIAVGLLTLRVPRQLGVRLAMVKEVLVSFEPNGLVRQGDAFVSPNYESATHHLDLNLTTTLGRVAIEWIGE